MPLKESVVSQSTMQIKISKNSLPLPKAHVNDFMRNLPDVYLAPSSESF